MEEPSGIICARRRENQCCGWAFTCKIALTMEDVTSGELFLAIW